MARKGKLIRGKNGRYVKETPSNKVKYYYNSAINTVKSWFKS
jgi:hypothetical protein|tara:strand:- start:224 stop:349 length:126 start_codon:yes stop_codon:yes gene_type:complete